MSLTPLEAFKLESLKARHPLLANASALEILECAIVDEGFARDCVFDPAGKHFFQSMHELEQMALLVEKSQS